MWGELKLGQELTIEQVSRQGLKPICDVFYNKEANGVKNVYLFLDNCLEKENYELFSPTACAYKHIQNMCQRFRDISDTIGLIIWWSEFQEVETRIKKPATLLKIAQIWKQSNKSINTYIINHNILTQCNTTEQFF